VSAGRSYANQRAGRGDMNEHQDGQRGLWLRRLIAVVAVALALTVLFILHSGLGANTRDETPSFFSNAAAVPAAYRKALGPTMLVIRLSIDATIVEAEILMGPSTKQRFVLDREVGYVVAHDKQTVEHPTLNQRAFSMTVVDFTELPAVIELARAKLSLDDNDAPTRVLIERPEAANQLRWRVFAGPERFVDVTR